MNSLLTYWVCGMAGDLGRTPTEQLEILLALLENWENSKNCRDLREKSV